MTNHFIARSLSATIEQALRYLPVVTLTGPRQSGKTTLCRNLFPDLPYANFEDVAVLAEVQSDPKAFLNKYPHGAIIDEAQRYPEIFSYLQVLVDEDRHNGNSERHFWRDKFFFAECLENAEKCVTLHTNLQTNELTKTKSVNLCLD